MDSSLRGALIDLKASTPEPSTAIYPEDLETWEKSTGIKIQPGDAVFIRTGRWARRAEKGPWDASAHSAGIYATCAKWLKQKDVAVLGSDGSHDVLPSGVDGVAWPVHQILLVAGHAPVRQLRFRRVGEGGGGAKSLDVPIYGRSFGRYRRNGLASESDRDFLVGTGERWMVGQSPWTARDARVPLFLEKEAADQGVGSGPGGPPPKARRPCLDVTRVTPSSNPALT